MRTNFVLLFEGRTGSTFIMDSLNSHENIIAHGEPLVRKDVNEQNDIINDIYNINDKNVQAVGFKTKIRDISCNDFFIGLLNKYQTKVIIMTRRNMIKTALSRINARRLFDKTGLWNLTDNVEKMPPFEVSIEQFEEAMAFRIDKENKLNNFVKQIDLPIKKFFYEDMLENQEQFFKKIFDFINVTDVDYSSMKSNIVKNTDDNMRNILLNYDEIKNHYKGTEYEVMFDV